MSHVKSHELVSLMVTGLIAVADSHAHIGNNFDVTIGLETFGEPDFTNRD